MNGEELEALHDEVCAELEDDASRILVRMAQQLRDGAPHCDRQPEEQPS